ncbi:hypothetical protein Slin15195_G032720 [Septoria linicola]|uniref:Uncharacterized protein n=1 Tax=Septoria linicola TaxID=215465 RepID=A0A9Q9EI44_9PEZI|nr:hypothetical protein Slin14017_G031750 [Septoria linicola]USW49953.1 hypothetical protein Slin15195_G032720 [Septoria linicola]
MGALDLKDVLGRLAGVDLSEHDDDGRTPVSLVDLDVGYSPASNTTITTSPAMEDASGSVSPAYTIRPEQRAITSTIGLVSIGSEIFDEDPSSNESPATPTKRSAVRDLVLSVIPSTLDVKFSPTPSRPQYGLIIKDTGAERGGGFVGVTFVNCRFSETAPTILQNCCFTRTTFKNCDFRSILLENVVMIDNKFIDCTFDNACWKNRKLSEEYIFCRAHFVDEQINEVEPKEIKAQNAAREAAVEARLSAPPPPNEPHKSGYSKQKGWDSLEDEHKRFKPVQPTDFSHETSSIPLDVGAGIAFDNTPRAGLTITAGHGCRFEEVQFTRSSFVKTTLQNCHFVNVSFEDCIFENVSFTEVVIMNRTYKNVWFHGCSWTRRVLTKPAMHQNETFRQGGQNLTTSPAIMSDYAAAQEARRVSEEARATAMAMIKRPPNKYQQKRERRDFTIKTELEIKRAQLAVGDRIVEYIVPTAVGARPKDAGTRFVMPSFD